MRRPVVAERGSRTGLARTNSSHRPGFHPALPRLDRRFRWFPISASGSAAERSRSPLLRIGPHTSTRSCAYVFLTRNAQGSRKSAHADPWLSGVVEAGGDGRVSTIAEDPPLKRYCTTMLTLFASHAVERRCRLRRTAERKFPAVPRHSDGEGRAPETS